MGVLEQKSKQYDQQRRNYEQILVKRGYDESIQHSKLVAQAKEVEKLRDLTSELSQQLRYYQDLPPVRFTPLHVYESLHAMMELTGNMAHMRCRISNRHD